MQFWNQLHSYGPRAGEGMNSVSKAKLGFEDFMAYKVRHFVENWTFSRTVDIHDGNEIGQ